MTMDPLIAVLSLFCLLSAFITFGLGAAAYIRSPQSAVNRLFLLAMVAASYWAFGEFMIWQAGSPEGVTFWLKACSFWPFVIAFTIHFVLTLTRPSVYERTRHLFLAIIYLPAGIISLILLFTNWIFITGFIPGTGYTYIPIRNSLAYQLESGYILLMMLCAVGVIIAYWRQATTNEVKNQALLICAAISTVILFGFLSGILLPAIGVYTPNLVFIGLVLFSLLITIAITKYELFILSPTTAVPDILRTMPDALLLTDMQGVIIGTNDAARKLFSTGEKDLIGHPAGMCIPDAVFGTVKSGVMSHHEIIDMETVPVRHGSRTVSIAGSLVLDPEGKPAGIVLIIRDITDRKNTEKSLRIAGEKISLLTRLTRHDINNLVSALSGYLLLIKESPCDPDNAIYVTAGIEIAEKIHNQLQFTREYQDIGSQQPVWQSLGLLVSRAKSDLHDEKTVVAMEVLPVEIYADPLIVKVIYNILENATRHGKDLTKILVSTRVEEDALLRVIIEDDGIGIQEEDKELIFHYGYGKNTGLGLAISRDILSLTGISIRETGKAGTGARFEIAVPRPVWRYLNA
jgi:PAS domain S-box-containing protein